MGEASRYLKAAPFVEGMNVFFSKESPEPGSHTIWYGDFMGMCKHDIPCPVCWNRHAVIRADVTPGQARSSVQPCDPCHAAGHEVMRLPRWLRWLVTPFAGERL